MLNINVLQLFAIVQCPLWHSHLPRFRRHAPPCGCSRTCVCCVSCVRPPLLVCVRNMPARVCLCLICVPVCHCPCSHPSTIAIACVPSCAHHAVQTSSSCLYQRPRRTACAAPTTRASHDVLPPGLLLNNDHIVDIFWWFGSSWLSTAACTQRYIVCMNCI